MTLEIQTVFRSRAQSRSLLLSALRRLVDDCRRYAARRATHRALSHLNEAELQDIGLIRTELGYRELHADRRGDNWWNE